MPKVLRWFLVDLVGDVAEAGVGDRELGQRPRMLRPVERPGERAHGVVDQRLVGAGEGGHGGPGALDQRGDDRLAVRRRAALQRARS